MACLADEDAKLEADRCARARSVEARGERPDQDLGYRTIRLAQVLIRRVGVSVAVRAMMDCSVAQGAGAVEPLILQRLGEELDAVVSGGASSEILKPLRSSGRPMSKPELKARYVGTRQGLVERDWATAENLKRLISHVEGLGVSRAEAQKAWEHDQERGTTNETFRTLVEEARMRVLDAPSVEAALLAFGRLRFPKLDLFGDI